MASVKDAAFCPSVASLDDHARPPVDDHTLMAEVARGDACAFNELCRRHLKTMTYVAQRIVGSAAEADEIAQEAFLRLWKYAKSWDPEGTGSVKTWLSKVVTNLSVDRYRRQRSVPLEEAGEIEDLGRGVFDTLGEADRKKLVQQLLDTLPERQKIAVILSYYENMTGREIAKAMDLSEGAVESLLVRARRSLREGVRKLGFVWGDDI